MTRFRRPAKTHILISLIFCIALLCVLYGPQQSAAEEAHREAGDSLIVDEIELENMHLSEISENIMIIDEEDYIVTDRTKYCKKDRYNKIRTVKIGEIVTPCLVDITYNTYSVYSEELPFHPGDRVLSSVVVRE